MHRRTGPYCFQTVMIEGSPEVLFTPYKISSSTSVHVDSTTPHWSNADIVDRETRERFLISHSRARRHTVWRCFGRPTLFFRHPHSRSRMAQGKTKLASKPSSGGRPNNGAMRKGKRVIPPKARSEINRKIMQQVCRCNDRPPISFDSIQESVCQNQ